MARNQIMAGDHLHKVIVMSGINPKINLGLFKGSLPLNKKTVESYELMDAESQISATSVVGRGLLGGFLLGPVGLLAAASAKKKGTYVVAVQFKDGKKSLMEVDDKVYKALQRLMF